jgi:hypothetical protein
MVDTAVQVEPDGCGLHDGLHHLGAAHRLELTEKPQDALQAADAFGLARQLPRARQVVFEDGAGHQAYSLELLGLVASGVRGCAA